MKRRFHARHARLLRHAILNGWLLTASPVPRRSWSPMPAAGDVAPMNARLEADSHCGVDPACLTISFHKGEGDAVK
jgi:hypothetical protein